MADSAAKARDEAERSASKTRLEFGAARAKAVKLEVDMTGFSHRVYWVKTPDMRACTLSTTQPVDAQCDWCKIVVQGRFLMGTRMFLHL